jgi:phage gp46-like protein
MASDKQAYELKANVNSAETAVGSKLITLDREKGTERYETKDPAEILALDNWDAVKSVQPAEKEGK